MVFEFDSEIKRLDGKIKWRIIYFPYSALETLSSKGNIPVVITVDGHNFEHTLLPSQNGHYLVYNEYIHKAVGKDIGEFVHVTLRKDTKIRKYSAPDYIVDYLDKAKVLDSYLRQPEYLQREQVNYIEIAKKEETKTNRLNALIRRLIEES